MSGAVHPDDDDVAAELAALRAKPYPDPADTDRGEVLAATGVALGVVGVGVVAAAAICPPCMLGLAPLCAVTAPVLVGAGAWKRWRRRR
jgi:hypothetical protein